MAENFDIESLKRPRSFGARNFLVPGSLKNRVIGDACTGYSIQISGLSYRTTWVATIEDIILKVNGVEVPKNIMLFCVNNKKFLVSQLKELFAEAWFALDLPEIAVNQIGGLPKGEYDIEVTLMRRSDFGYTHEFPANPVTDRGTFTVA